MSVASQLAHVNDDLAYYYRRQREAEHAALDGRVTNHAELRLAIDRRAETIRMLEERRAGLLRTLRGEAA